MPIGGIYQLINLWHGKRILWTRSVQVSKVNTDPPFAVLLFYHHSIREPLREENLLYSPSFLQSKAVIGSIQSVFFYLANRN